MINEDRLQKALVYLAETDEEAAKARAYMIGLEKNEKTIIGIEYLKTQGTVPERDARARKSEAYEQWKSDYENAVADYELYRNKRHTEELIVEVWRSENANRRRGNV
ncbi:MAG: hypothetical protein AB2792_22250 [Candidatus Thiodiazotropha sp.]